MNRTGNRLSVYSMTGTIHLLKMAPLFLMFAGRLNLPAETNSPSHADNWLSVPHLQLREVLTKDEVESQFLPIESDESVIPETLTLTNSFSLQSKPDASFSSDQAAAANREAALYRQFQAQGCFTKKEEPPDNYFVRSVTTMFDSAPVHVGKVTVNCTLISAIKKKNPLCLLNPFVLIISW